MRKSIKKALTGAASAAMLVSGSGAETVVAQTMQMDQAITTETPAVAYKAIANVEGTFVFDQNRLTPTDDAFNVFGTALTGVCAKPTYALESGKTDYYVNVGGKIRKSYSVNLQQAQSEKRVLLCSCATGPAVANVNLTGVPVEDILSFAELDEGANVIKFVGSDGYGDKLPLSYVLEKKAMVVYEMNGERLTTGAQIVIPETVARYFTRDVVDIELSAQTDVPSVVGRDEAYRAEVALMNRVDGCVFAPGSDITFEGYADDCGDPITAVEFSMDSGASWTTCDTSNATADRWVYWNFTTNVDDEGTYQMSVRARTASGRVSPLAANAVFTVAGEIAGI